MDPTIICVPTLARASRFYIPARGLEILFAPHEIEPWFAVHVAFAMQLAAQHLRPAEENARLGRRVDLADRLEHCVPVGPPEAGRRP